MVIVNGVPIEQVGPSRRRSAQQSADDRAIACCGRSGVLDLAALRALALCGVDAGDEAWRLEATRRWGELAGGGPRAEGRNWEAYVTSRLSKPPPPSPEPLLQEFVRRNLLPSPKLPFVRRPP